MHAFYMMGWAFAKMGDAGFLLGFLQTSGYSGCSGAVGICPNFLKNKRVYRIATRKYVWVSRVRAIQARVRVIWIRASGSGFYTQPKPLFDSCEVARWDPQGFFLSECNRDERGRSSASGGRNRVLDMTRSIQALFSNWICVILCTY
jgi:hypothetical protein